MSRRERFEMYRERLGPYVGGLVSAMAAVIWHAELSACLIRASLDTRQAVSSTFDVMITLTAFLFTVFVLAIAPGGGFIEKIFGTRTFVVFKRYVIEALLLGALSALASLAFIVSKSNAFVWAGYVPEALWLGLAVAAVLAFLRVVHIFMAWVGFDAQHRKPSRTR